MKELKYGQVPVEPSFWFLEAALYHHEDYSFPDCEERGFRTLRSNLMAVIFPKITIDVYCPKCKRETVFNPVERKDDWLTLAGYPAIGNGINYSHFRCSRAECNANLYYVFHLSDGVLTKIGQYPSIADLLSLEIKKYKPVLGSDLISDWQRAIGLRAHGIGAGSYVYLRRIIEKMVNDAAELAINEGEVDEEAYSRSRWPEKIKMLSKYLPEYLVRNAKVYGVLSKGVHELSEEECSDYFDVVHTSIEIICEEKLAELERKKKASAGEKALQKVLQQIEEKQDSR